MVATKSHGSSFKISWLDKQKTRNQMLSEFGYKGTTFMMRGLVAC